MSVMSNKCEKIDSTPKLDADGLPFATQTGANTFGCLINGEPWFVNQKFPYLKKTYSISITNFADTSFSVDVSALSKNTPNSADYITIIKEGKNIITVGSYNQKDFMNSINSRNSREATLLNHRLNITKFDTTRRIISGNFELKLECPRQFGSGGIYDTLHFTKGRFDGKW